jgi:Ribbon-helix-helix protein, copG family
MKHQIPVAEVDTEELRETESGLVRLTVKLSRSVAAALRSLAEKHGTTKTEEVRRALSLWKFLDDARENQWSVLLEKDGQFREIVIDVLRGE